jgi:hypothetical protein
VVAFPVPTPIPASTYPLSCSAGEGAGGRGPQEGPIISDTVNGNSQDGRDGEVDGDGSARPPAVKGRGGSGLTADQTCMGCLLFFLLTALTVAGYIYYYWRNTPELNPATQTPTPRASARR